MVTKVEVEANIITIEGLGENSVIRKILVQR